MAGENAMDLLSAAQQALASIPLPPAVDQFPRGVKPMQWEELAAAATKAPTASPRASSRETLDLRVELGRTSIARDEVPTLRTGSVLPLDNAAGEPVGLYVGEELIARGEVLVINGTLGIRVLERISHRQCA